MQQGEMEITSRRISCSRQTFLLCEGTKANWCVLRAVTRRCSQSCMHHPNFQFSLQFESFQFVFSSSAGKIHRFHEFYFQKKIYEQNARVFRIYLFQNLKRELIAVHVNRLVLVRTRFQLTNRIFFILSFNVNYAPCVLLFYFNLY